MPISPPRLRAGDRLAAVSLSWGGPGTFPHRYEAGKRQLEAAFGVEVVEMPHTLADAARLAADPAARAGDLHRLAGIVFGRPGGADLPVAAHSEYDAAILQVVRDEEDLTEVPIGTNGDVGHTDPRWTVPQGGPHAHRPDGIGADLPRTGRPMNPPVG